MLTCRIPGGRTPVRIICDTHGRIPVDSNIVKSADTVRTIIAVSDKWIDTSDGQEKANKLNDMGAEVLAVPENDGHIDLKALMTELGALQIDGILLEGGGTLNESALKAGVVNEVDAYIAPKIFGGAGHSPVDGEGVSLPDEAYRFRLAKTEQYGEDVLLIYKNYSKNIQAIY